MAISYHFSCKGKAVLRVAQLILVRLTRIS